MTEKMNKIIEQLKSMGCDDAKISKYFDAQYDVLKQNAEEEKRRLDAERDLRKFDIQQETKRLDAERDLRKFDIQQETKRLDAERDLRKFDIQQEARRQADAYINQEFMEKHFPRR